MAQYMLNVIHPDPLELASAERERVSRDVDALNGEMKASGAWVFAAGLHSPGSATTLRRQGDDVLVTDGPFAEAAEYVGGFWIIEAADLDAALDWARKATKACGATIEVRPLHSEPPQS